MPENLPPSDSITPELMSRIEESRIEEIVIESTYNWYWLVDGLMERDHKVHLANTAAIQQYSGLKHTDDDSERRAPCRRDGQSRDRVPRHSQ
jgi:transposase